jgi:hypothetical protein
MPGSVITAVDVATGICFGHGKYPIPWTGRIIPMQFNVMVDSGSIAEFRNIVMCSCGHYGYLMASNPTVLTNDLPTPAGVEMVIPGNAMLIGTMIGGMGAPTVLVT